MTALTGLRVVELAREPIAFAGKLLADMGAEVILVEPPGGDPSRGYPPFLDDQPGADRSLYWWHYHTNKRGVVLDLDTPDDAERFRALIASADVLLECEPRARLAGLGLDYEQLLEPRPDLIHVSVTPFGRDDPKSDLPYTDLTIMAGAGPPASCATIDSIPVPTIGARDTTSGTACLIIFDPIRARLASSFSKNGIRAAATETSCLGATSA